MKKHEHRQLFLALEFVCEGKWNQAHEIVQRLDSPMACRIHALLHRIEGDTGNANYWYRQSGVAIPKLSIESETQGLLEELNAMVKSE